MSDRFRIIYYALQSGLIAWGLSSPHKAAQVMSLCTLLLVFVDALLLDVWPSNKVRGR